MDRMATLLGPQQTEGPKDSQNIHRMGTDHTKDPKDSQNKKVGLESTYTMDRRILDRKGSQNKKVDQASTYMDLGPGISTELDLTTSKEKWKALVI